MGYRPRQAPLFFRTADVIDESETFWQAVTQPGDIHKPDGHGFCFHEIQFFTPSHSAGWHFEKADAEQLRATVRETPAVPRSAAPVVCLNQRLGGTRFIENVGEVMQLLLTRYEADVRYLAYENKTITQQAASIAQCSVVVHPHGGGMTNIMFMSTYSLVVEIFPYRYAPVHYYSELASSSGLRHVAVICDEKHSHFLRSECLSYRFDAMEQGECDTNSTCHWCYKDSSMTVDIDVLAAALDSELLPRRL